MKQRAPYSILDSKVQTFQVRLGDMVDAMGEVWSGPLLQEPDDQGLIGRNEVFASQRA